MLISINGTERKPARSWDELSQEDLLKAWALCTGPVNMEFKRLELMRMLLDIEVQLLDSWAEEDNEFLDKLTELVDQVVSPFFEKDDDGNFHVSRTLTKCPYPVLEDDEHPLYASKDAMANISIYEMCYIFAHLEKLGERPQPADIANILAMIYRESKPETTEAELSAYGGDRRRPLLHAEDRVQLRAERLATLPALVQSLLMFWVISCRNKIVSDYPLVFKKDEDGGNIAGERQGNDYGYAGLLLSLSGGIAHLDAVSSQEHGDALTYLSMLEDERRAREIQEKMNPRR